MKKASQYFNDERRRRVGQAVAAAERNTSAEIVPCVVTASGRYDRAEDIVGLWLGMIGLALVYLFCPQIRQEPGSWNTPNTWVFPTLMILVPVMGFVLGAVVASRVGWLRRLFIPAREMRDETLRRARAVFFDQHVHHTAGATGVLLLVSLYERRAAVLADEAILDKLGPTALQDVCDALTSHLRHSHPADALCEAIALVGKKLAAVLPRDAADIDELPDALVTIDGDY